MAVPIFVDDPGDPRIAAYVDVRDRQLRRAARERREGLFVAEGKQVVRRLTASSYPVHSLLVTPARAADLADVIAALDAPVYVAAPDVLRETVGFDLHRGALAIGRRLTLPAPETLLAAATTVLVLEDLNDHENLGAIFRSAAALGADAVLLSPTTADPLYRRCVRVSMGAALFVPFAPLAPWPGGLQAVADAGFRILALTPDPGAIPIEMAVGRGGRSALLLGAEGPGLSPAALAHADVRVRIPLRAGVDSLNVGHAAAIAMHRLVPP